MSLENFNTNNFKYTAIIIEPRKHKALEFVLNNACECLSDEWRIILFHGKKNDEYSIEIVKKLNIIYSNRISLVNLHVDNLNQDSYSHLFTNRNTIYDHIDTEIFIVFQTDSLIIKKNAHMIHEYLNYDYVGSPWLITNYEPTKKCSFIGNGGFSLRNKKKMLEIIEKIPYKNKFEDLFFSTNYDNISVIKPSYEKAKCFCVGEAFNNETTFAVHQFWTRDYNSLIQNYPECEILMKLQDEEI